MGLRDSIRKPKRDFSKMKNHNAMSTEEFDELLEEFNNNIATEEDEKRIQQEINNGTIFSYYDKNGNLRYRG